MLRDKSSFTGRLLLLGMGTILFVFLATCRHGMEITARTTISGIVNGSAMEGKVVATFNPSRGGSSSCEFSKLPVGFTPATIGTHT